MKLVMVMLTVLGDISIKQQALMWFWRLLAAIFVSIGLIGVIVPSLPTTPFMLLALWASSKGWPVLHDWLLEHPKFGPHFIRWQEQRIIPRKAKIAASLMMVFSALLAWFSVPLLWVLVLIYLCLLAVLAWLWCFVPSSS